MTESLGGSESKAPQQLVRLHGTRRLAQKSGGDKSGNIDIIDSDCLDCVRCVRTIVGKCPGASKSLAIGTSSGACGQRHTSRLDR